MTPTELLVPPEWEAAIDAEPNDLTLRLAFADWLRDHDRGGDADAVAWTAAKRVVWDGETERNGQPYYHWTGTAVWPAFSDAGVHTHPGSGVCWEYIFGYPNTPSHAFHRLMRVWAKASPEQLQRLWKWSPPNGGGQGSPQTYPLQSGGGR